MKIKIIKKHVTINAKSPTVFHTFTDPNRLTTWLHAHSAVVALCKNGPYSIGWGANDDGDYYVCCGKIHTIELNKIIHITDVHYYQSNKKIIGPLNLKFKFEGKNETTVVSLKQSGVGVGKKWEQNFEAVLNSWEEALFLLKKHLEKK